MNPLSRDTSFLLRQVVQTWTNSLHLFRQCFQISGAIDSRSVRLVWNAISNVIKDCSEKKKHFKLQKEEKETIRYRFP